MNDLPDDKQSDYKDPEEVKNLPVEEAIRFLKDKDIDPDTLAEIYKAQEALGDIVDSAIDRYFIESDEFDDDESANTEDNS